MIRDLNQVQSRVSEAQVILPYTMFPRTQGKFFTFLKRWQNVTIIFEASFLPAGKIKLDEHELMTTVDERRMAINLIFVIT